MHIISGTLLRYISFSKTILKTPNISQTERAMTQPLPIQAVLKKLNHFAGIDLAEPWDNVGLLIEPATSRPISHILLTNDLTEAVVQEALALDVSLIVTYHPLIFAPLKSITMKNWKERITSVCLENRIAVFSPHTSWDCVQGGVNDWLANSFEIIKSEPIVKGVNPTVGAGRICKLKSEITIQKAVELVKARIGLPHIRLALAIGKTMKSTIQSVAVCAGSGTSVFKGVNEVDLLLTGEMQHHDILDAVQNGKHVILCNHSDSERGFLNEFKPKLVNMFNGQIKVSVSAKDKDPLTTV